MTLNVTVIVALIVGAWLIICSICDWRKREIPSFLSIVPFVMVVLWSAIYGNAPASLLSVLMLFVTSIKRSPAIAITILSLAFALILGYFILQHTSENFLPIFIVCGVALLWFFGKTGGADAQVLMTITLAFGSSAFMYAVVAGGLFGIIGLAFKQKTIPYVIPITAGMITYFLVNLI